MICLISKFNVLKSDRGVSLVEVAVAIIVLGIVLVGLFPLVIDSVRLSVQNSEVAQANRIVASELDKVRSSMASGPCVAESAKVLPLNAPESAKFTAKRTVDCGLGLATVTIDVYRNLAPASPAATAKTKVKTG